MKKILGVLVAGIAVIACAASANAGGEGGAALGGGIYSLQPAAKAKTASPTTDFTVTGNHTYAEEGCRPTENGSAASGAGSGKADTTFNWTVGQANQKTASNTQHCGKGKTDTGDAGVALQPPSGFPDKTAPQVQAPLTEVTDHNGIIVADRSKGCTSAKSHSGKAASIFNRGFSWGSKVASKPCGKGNGQMDDANSALGDVSTTR
jgi:hypothetical protein